MTSSTASPDPESTGINAPLTLVIDSVSRACSAALFSGDVLISSDYREIGRGHAEHLVPMIEGLPGAGKADRIAVNCGPGSFTGVRIGLSVARALAFAWNAELIGYDSLSIVAAGAIAKAEECERMAVLMQGGHGEYLAGLYGRGGQPLTDARSLPPENLKPFLGKDFIAGDAFAALGIDKDMPGHFAAFPDARDFCHLTKQALVRPEARYARPPDAKIAAKANP